MSPRNIAGQVVRGKDLWGRSAELDELWRKVERGSVLLAAPRRYGKSSLMYGMVDGPRPGWDVVYLNVEYVESPAELATELAARILAHRAGRRILSRVQQLPGVLQRWFAGIVEEVGVGVPDVGEIKLKLRAQAPEDWRAALEPLWRLVAEGEPRILVILDELPVMVATLLDRDHDAALRFLHWFRALRQEGGRFLLGGSVNIEALLSGYGQSALLNDLERVRLLPFTPERREEFVRAVLEGEGQAPADRKVPAQIAAALDSGVPFFLQVYLDELLTECRRRSVIPTAALAELVLQDAVLGPRCVGRFDHYLGRLRSYGRLETAAREVLHEVSGDRPVHVSRMVELAGLDAGRVVALLESDWYVERDGDIIRFADGFVRRWWRRNAPMGRRS